MKMWFIFEVRGLLGFVEYYAVFEQSEELARDTLEKQLIYNYEKIILIETRTMSQVHGYLRLNKEVAE